MKDEDVMKILEMVKEGKLSPDEARELISALEDADRTKGHGGSPPITHRRIRVESPRLGRVIEASVEGALRDLDVEGIVEASVGRATEWAEGLAGNASDDLRAGDPTQNMRFSLPAGTPFLEIEAEVASASMTFAHHPDHDVIFRYWGPDPRPRLRFRGTTLSIAHELKRSHLFWGIWRDKVAMEVLIPEGVRLRGSVELQNGRLEIKGPPLQNFQAETLNGPISISAKTLEGVSFETKNGAVAVAAAEVHRLDAEAMNGKIDVAGMLEDVSLETVNGRLFAHAFQGSRGDLHAETARGAVSIRMPKGIGYKLDAEATVGAVRLSLDGSQEWNESPHGLGREVHLSRGDRSLRLNLKTQLGSITVEEEPA